MNIHRLIATYGYFAVLGLIAAESFGISLDRRASTTVLATP